MDGVWGLIASEVISGFGNPAIGFGFTSPVLTGVQFAPESTVRKMRPRLPTKPAYSVEGVCGSMASEVIASPNRPLLIDIQLVPALVVRKTWFPLAAYNVEGLCGSMTSALANARPAYVQVEPE